MSKFKNNKLTSQVSALIKSEYRSKHVTSNKMTVYHTKEYQELLESLSDRQIVFFMKLQRLLYHSKLNHGIEKQAIKITYDKVVNNRNHFKELMDFFIAKTVIIPAPELGAKVFIFNPHIVNNGLSIEDQYAFGMISKAQYKVRTKYKLSYEFDDGEI